MYLVTVYDIQHSTVGKFKEQNYTTAINRLSKEYDKYAVYDIRKVA